MKIDRHNNAHGEFIRRLQTEPQMCLQGAPITGPTALNLMKIKILREAPPSVILIVSMSHQW